MVLVKLHSLNISPIVSTFSVLKPDKSRYFNFDHLANISFIFLTLEVQNVINLQKTAKFSKFKFRKKTL